MAKEPKIKLMGQRYALTIKYKIVRAKIGSANNKQTTAEIKGSLK